MLPNNRIPTHPGEIWLDEVFLSKCKPAMNWCALAQKDGFLASQLWPGVI
jgi:hypothetical protein